MLAALVATTAIAAFSLPAGAQMFESAWSGSHRDGLSTAIIMKQVDSGMYDNTNGSSVVSSGSSSSEVLLCGGDGSEGSNAGSTANSSCIILGDNANAIIDLGQDSDGDQNSNSDVDTGNLSDALESLNNGG
jgi:hypothetical protein